MGSPSVRVRFAPSPTGIPHIGNTRTALYNYLFAQKNKGTFVLRIEDTDRKRLVEGSLEKILEILKLVGIRWDEGPEVGGPYIPYVQSERLTLYREHALKLVEHKKAYYCFCTIKRLEELRKEQMKTGGQPRYDRHCLKLDKAEIEAKLKAKTPYVIRLLVPDKQTISWQDLVQGPISFKSDSIDDQVLLKADGYPTYHLGVVVDDYVMKITHVLRGAEWISSTPKHILLYRAFGWELPEFGHFPIILGSDKAKLSKRHGAKSALDYYDEGYLPEALVTFMAYLGWSHEDNSQLLSLNELTKYFDLTKVQQANPIFDIEKLNYFNGLAIRRLPYQELLKRLKPFLPQDCSENLAPKIVPLVKDRMVKLLDFENLTSFFYRPIKAEKALIVKQSQKKPGEIKAALERVSAEYEKTGASAWQGEKLEAVGRKLAEEMAWSPKELFMTLRLALTAKTATPPLFETMAILGKETTLKRLHHASDTLS